MRNSDTLQSSQPGFILSARCSRAEVGERPTERCGSYGLLSTPEGALRLRRGFLAEANALKSSLRMNNYKNGSRLMEQTADKTHHLAPEEWVERYGDCLFRHACARVSQPEVAEDLVQEALIAAWKSRAEFGGRASEKTWLMRILRNKIADYYRKQRLKLEATDLDALQELEEQQFENGWSGTHWQKGTAPRTWANPRQSLERAEFWKVVYECTSKLPGKVAQVFLLREVDDLASDEICRELNIKPSHLFVLTHRARLALRRCLELRWFRNERATVVKPT